MGIAISVVLLLATACAPQAPDHSSWIDQAHKALEDAGSEVATVALVLRLAERDDVPHKYQQVVAQESERNAGMTMDALGGEQPPAHDDATYTRVTGLLSDASDLVSQARIAIVREDTGEYPKLLRQLDHLQKQLTKAEHQVRARA